MVTNGLMRSSRNYFTFVAAAVTYFHDNKATNSIYWRWFGTWFMAYGVGGSFIDGAKASAGSPKENVAERSLYNFYTISMTTPPAK